MPALGRQSLLEVASLQMILLSFMKDFSFMPQIL